ncbi:hypothetical protein ES705_44260 [subsurface metagenome]
MANKRIFTKIFHEAIPVMGVTLVKAEPAKFWLMQEDIEVLGAEISIFNTAPDENDGYAYIYVELSQVGMLNADGIILAAAAIEYWNTTPAGIDVDNAQVVTNFPPGFVVPIREEGYLYVNTAQFGKTAGTSAFTFDVIVYYTKKGTARTR